MEELKNGAKILFKYEGKIQEGEITLTSKSGKYVLINNSIWLEVAEKSVWYLEAM